MENFSKQILNNSEWEELPSSEWEKPKKRGRHLKLDLEKVIKRGSGVLVGKNRFQEVDTDSSSGDSDSSAGWEPPSRKVAEQEPDRSRSKVCRVLDKQGGRRVGGAVDNDAGAEKNSQKNSKKSKKPKS